MRQSEQGCFLSRRLNGAAGFRLSFAAALTLAAVASGAFAQVTIAAPGDISTVAGNGTYASDGDGGPATAAATGDVEGVFFSPGDGFHLIDAVAHKVRYVDAGGLISTVAGGGASDPGDGGPATAALLGHPEQVISDRHGNIYFSEGNRVRRVSMLGIITTFAGTGTAGFSGDGGPATAAQVNRPHGLALDLYGNLFIADNDNHRIRRVSALGVITTVAGTGTAGYTGDGGPATAAQLSGPVDVGVDTAGRIFIADNGNHAVRMIDAAGDISTVAGTGTVGFSGDGGPATAAMMNGPQGVDVDGAGNVYIAEAHNHIIRRFSVGGTITTVAGTATTAGFAGDGGPATAAELDGPREVSFDYATGDFYIADRYNNRVRRVQALGVPETPPTVNIDSAPASPSNDPTPSWSFSVASSQQVTFDCRLTRGATVVSDWTGCSSPHSYDLSAEVDGSYSLAVRAVTVSGVGSPTTSAYVLDTTAPAAPSIDSSPPSPGNDATPTWGFSGEPAASFECRLERGATVVSDWTACSSPRSYDLSTEPDGTYTFSVRQSDAAGNTSSPSTHVYVLDTAAPAAPSIGSSPPSPGNDATPTWGFSGEPGASFECRLERGATVVSDWASCSSPRSYDLSTEPDGTYTFSVRQSDAAGNTSAPSTDAYVLDTAAPGAPSIDSSPPSPGNDATPTWGFSGEPGASFECRLERGATVVSDWASCASPRSYDLSSEPDGGYTFSVRQSDGAGNTSAPVSDAYVLDTTAPGAPSIDSPPSSPGNDATPTWGFSGEAGASFECRLERGATVVSDWASCSSPRSYDLSAEPDGSYTFSVRQSDAAGNTSAPSTDGYVLDTTAPAAPSIDSSPPSPGNDATPTWGFSGEPAASFECRLERGATVVSDWASCSSPRSYDLSSEPDGTYTFSVRQSDAAGNTSAPSTDAYVLDTAAPGAPSIGSSPPSPGNDATPTWGFSGEPAASFECRLERGATVVSDWTACSSPRSYDLSSEPDGAYTFSVRQSDGAGNTSAPVTDAYVLDTTAPAAPSIDSPPSSPGNDATPTWGFSGEAGASFECRLTRGATVVSDWASCSSPRSYDLSSEPDGTYTFSVRQSDAAGNTSSPSTHFYVLDTAAPGAPSIDSSPPSPGNDATPTWGFSGEAGASFECRLTRGATVVSDWASCSSPRSYDLSSEPDGTYTFSVRQSDAAGNTSAPSTDAYVLDTAAPGAPSIDSSPPSPGNDATPTWGFSGEPAASFECRLERGATVVSDWTACSSPRSYDLSTEPDGTYTFSVRQSDAAGNTSSPSTHAYVLDTAAPSAPSIGSSPSSPGNDATPTWGFSGEAAASFECRLERGATVVSDWASCSSPRSYDLSSEPDGTYTFSVRQSDGAGNTSAPVSDGYVLDTTAPGAPSIGSSPSSPGNDATPTWGFSGEAGASFECRLERGATVVSDWASCSSPRTFDLSSEPDGGYTFSVRQSDGAGNTSAPVSDAYVLDTTAPAAPSIDSPPSSPGNDATPTWGFSGEAGASFECRLERGATVVSDWASCSSPRSYDLSAEPDGSYTFSVRQSDAAGNTSAPSTDGYVLDTTAPAAPSIDSNPGAVGSSRTPSWSFSGEFGAVHECRLTRSATVVADWSPCAGGAAYDLAGEPDGTYTFGVRGRDQAGNTGPAASSDYRLDTVGADVTIESGPGPLGNSATPTWSFSGEPGASFECSLERAGSPVSDWASCSSPHGYDLASESDGGYIFRVRSRDDAGNLGAAVSYGYELDRAAPAAPDFTRSPGALGNDTTPRWELAAEPGAVIECSLLRAGIALGPWEPCAGQRSVDLAAEGDGNYALAARATDLAGNTGPSAQSAYRLDTTAPDAPEITDSPGASGRDRTVSWAFIGEDGADFECRLARGATIIDAWGSCTSRARYDLTDSANGDHLFNVRARDQAGNVGPASNSDYELLGAPMPGGAAPAPPPAPNLGGQSSKPASSDRGSHTSRSEQRDRPAARGRGSEPDGSSGRGTADDRLVPRLARAAGQVAQRAAFPALLVFQMLLFFAIQDRIDRRDPKLALAPINDEPYLTFAPPNRGESHP